MTQPSCPIALCTDVPLNVILHQFLVPSPSQWPQTTAWPGRRYPSFPCSWDPVLCPPAYSMPRLSPVCSASSAVSPRINLAWSTHSVKNYLIRNLGFLSSVFTAPWIQEYTAGSNNINDKKLTVFRAICQIYHSNYFTCIICVNSQ